jgi:hypothetical protein
MNVNSKAYEARYAADMREAALEEAIAKALCDACYGAGSWDSIRSRPEGAGQLYGWKKQARAAMLVIEQWDR